MIKALKWSGLNYISESFTLLKNNKSLWTLCIVPVLLCLVAFTFGFYIFGDVYNWIRAFLPSFSSNDANISTQESWFFVAFFKLIWIYILKLLSWTADLFIGLITLILMYQVALSLISIIASPFNDTLSARIEELIHPTGKPPVEPSILSSIRIAALTETQRLSIFLGIFIPLYFMSFILPGVGQLIFSIFAPTYTALWLSYDSQVYAMDRRDWKMGKRIKFLLKSPLKNFGLGFWMMLFMLIPLLHFLVFPIFVTAGTLAFIDNHSNNAGQGHY